MSMVRPEERSAPWAGVLATLVVPALLTLPAVAAPHSGVSRQPGAAFALHPPTRISASAAAAAVKQDAERGKTAGARRRARRQPVATSVVAVRSAVSAGWVESTDRREQRFLREWREVKASQAPVDSPSR